MSYFVFIDNSNVWIEGKIASAVAKGWAKNTAEAHMKKIEDKACALISESYLTAQQTET